MSLSVLLLLLFFGGDYFLVDCCYCSSNCENKHLFMLLTSFSSGSDAGDIVEITQR